MAEIVPKDGWDSWDERNFRMYCVESAYRCDTCGMSEGHNAFVHGIVWSNQNIAAAAVAREAGEQCEASPLTEMSQPAASQDAA